MTLQLDLKQAQYIKTILNEKLSEDNVEYYVFGSRVKGTAKPYSDVDIVLIGKKPISLFILSALEEIFAESDLPFKVDLVDWHRISSEFQETIKNRWEEL